MSKNKMRLLFGILSILSFLMVGCANNSDQDQEIEITSKTNEISLQDAKDAGMLVLEGMEITSGLERWNEFYKNVTSGKIDEITIAKYYELGDASHYAPEHYEEIKDDYPILHISTLKYDGKGYHLSYYEDSKLYSYDYAYMIERVGHLSPTAAVADHFFALVNDRQLSYHDIKWSMLSSKMDDSVDYKDVFTESISLENYKARKPGTYGTKEGSASLILNENCEFEFIRGIALSYSPVGRYYTEGNRLVLYVNDEEMYYFKMKEKGVLEFVSGKYAEDIVGIGTEFIYETESLKNPISTNDSLTVTDMQSTDEESGYAIDFQIKRWSMDVFEGQVREVSDIILKQYVDYNPVSSKSPNWWNREFSSSAKIQDYLGCDMLILPTWDLEETMSTLTVLGDKEGNFEQLYVEIDYSTDNIRMQSFSYIFTDSSEQDSFFYARGQNETYVQEEGFTQDGIRYVVITFSENPDGYMCKDSYMIKNGVLYNFHLAYSATYEQEAEERLEQWMHKK